VQASLLRIIRGPTCGNKNNYNTADGRVIAKIKQQKRACFESKAGPRKKSLAFLFEEINSLKRNLQLKPEKTASSKKRKAESIFFSLY
jgi:hypothetical protein